MLTYHKNLRNIILAAAKIMNRMEERTFNTKAHPNKWSKKEILGHMIDSAYNNHQRIARASSQDNLVFSGYDQNEWVIRNNYQQRAKAEVIQTWLTVNQHLAYLIENIPEEQQQRLTSAHNFHQISMNPLPEGETSSLSYLIWDYIFHVEHHLAQIIVGYEEINGDFKR